MPTKALLIDLCDTLMPFDNSRMPQVEIEGTKVHTTSRVVYDILKQFLLEGEVPPYPDFYRLFLSCLEQIGAIREETHREIPSHGRFSLLLSRMREELPEGNSLQSVNGLALAAIVQAHLEEISHCLLFEPAHRSVLEHLKKKYRLALVSNFDHAPTVWNVLRREGIHPFFERIIVSAEVGYRKPHPAIFQAALHQLGVAPQEAIFVGDGLEVDIRGAERAGIPAIWMNRRGDPLPPDVKPLAVIKSLEELPLVV